jgi:hypothetical protein
MFSVLARFYGEVLDLATMTARPPGRGGPVASIRDEGPGHGRSPRASRPSIAAKAAGRSAIVSMT